VVPPVPYLPCPPFQLLEFIAKITENVEKVAGGDFGKLEALVVVVNHAPTFILLDKTWIERSSIIL